ncbi:MAG: DUF86 domain-containing protein [Phaeodactylibacter sp.]|nr:DUF86 domain-containing protein [Phaeodactylibacter sp.]
MSERSDKVLVEDMIEAARRILLFTEGMDFDSFSRDLKTSDAVLRNLQVLGEAAKMVSSETRDAYPEVEWSKIIRSRHIVVHEYFGVDFEIVWRIVEVHIPVLKRQLSLVLKKMN